MFFEPLHFNSRPSARGDDILRLQEAIERISIHAPPRGATLFIEMKRRKGGFQFTPLREGRPGRYLVEDGAMNFNSRPSARGDTGIRLDFDDPFISIHAPPRGATRRCRPDGCESAYFNSRPSARGDEDVEGVLQKAKHFNSRPSARGDGKSSALTWRYMPFQFTPLREGRHGNRRERLENPFYFNSRPSARGDSTMHRITSMDIISIHAPPRGATDARRPPRHPRRYFNSRPSARGDDVAAALSD